MRLAALAFAATLAASPLCAAAPLTIPLDLSGVRPAVSISISGGPAELWVFDTGAMGSVMDIARAQALGLPNEGAVRVGSPAGGTPQEGFLTTLSGASINGAALPPLRVVAAPLPLPDRSGVLSPNAFRGQFVTFDFGHAQARITDKTRPPRGEATAYIGAGPHMLPALHVALGAQSWTAHIDTGAPGGLTFPYAMASQLPLKAAPALSGHARFVDGVHDRYRGQINGVVRVGPLTLTDPEVEFIDGLPDLNIGMRLLTQMTITLDPAEQRDWAEASPAPAPIAPAVPH